MNLGENVKKLRMEMGVTQKEMAESLFFTPQLISSIENGWRVPSLNVAMAIADYFGISVEELTGR